MKRIRMARIFGLAVLLLALPGILLLLGSSAEPGTVAGEFHDKVLYEQALAENTDMKTWDDKRLWEDASGATIQAKTFGHEVGRAEVWLNGEVLAWADGFAQFWAQLDPGEYILTGKCEGYKEQRITVTIESGRKTYINFILEPVGHEK
ncbi:MAG: hypothetical protein JW874_04335 [Spirochaetales bacterium]|nr:hypothetical protein [Spirochaetales bacterium]